MSGCMVKQLINSPAALHNMTITLVFLIMNISDIYMSTVWSYNVYTVSACLLSVLRAPEPSQNAFTRALKTHLFSTARHHWDVEMFVRNSGTEYKCSDLLTYLLIYVCLCVSVSVWALRRLKVSIALIKLFELLWCLSLERSSSSKTLVDDGPNTPQVRLGIIAQRHQHFRSLHRQTRADTYSKTHAYPTSHTHTHKQTDRDRKTSSAIIKHLDLWHFEYTTMKS